MAEIPVVVGPGGMRHTTAVTSAAETVLDLAAFAGKYVTVLADQALFYAQVPATGTYTISTSGAVAAASSAAQVAAAALAGASVACVPGRLFAGEEKPLYVSAKFTRLLVRAQSTSTSYIEVKEQSDGLTPA